MGEQSFKTVSLDCRGHGKSEMPDEYTLKDHVQDILSLIDYLNVASVNLYGVSMGSYIAQGVAIEQPHKIKKLILTVPKSNGLTSSTQRFFEVHANELEGLDEQEKMMFLFKHITYDSEMLFKCQEFKSFNSSLTAK